MIISFSWLNLCKVGSETLQYERETLQHGEGDGAASEAHRQHGHGKVTQNHSHSSALQ